METENISSRWIPKHEQRTFEKCPAIRLYKTPHSQLFADDMLEKIISATWKISAQSDRTGYRLEGAKIDSPPSQPSMANLVGNIQITPSGTPIVTLNDGPTVGGYPVIATIHPEDRNHFVQRPPGANVHFTWYE